MTYGNDRDVQDRTHDAGGRSSEAWHHRAREAPLLAVLILTGLIVVAVFADVIAPYDPTLPVQGAKYFAPPFWMEGGSLHTPWARTFRPAMY